LRSEKAREGAREVEREQRTKEGPFKKSRKEQEAQRRYEDRAVA